MRRSATVTMGTIAFISASAVAMDGANRPNILLMFTDQHRADGRRNRASSGCARPT